MDFLKIGYLDEESVNPKHHLQTRIPVNKQEDSINQIHLIGFSNIQTMQ